MARHKIKADVAIKATKPMSTMYRLNDDHRFGSHACSFFVLNQV